MSKIFTDEEGKRYEVDEQVSLLRDCFGHQAPAGGSEAAGLREPSRHSK